MDSSGSNKSSGGDDHNRGGPCGACKFLRRKCEKGCIFAPYFDSDQGTVHFAAVHKVFGASNASKLLLRIPAHKRVDAVVTLCYEALARAKDPVYGCVAHIFALQQQVVNLQAELANVHARLSTLQRLPEAPPFPQPQSSCSSLDFAFSNSTDHFHFDHLHHHHLLQTHYPTSTELTTILNPSESDQQEQQQLQDGDLQPLAREFMSRFLPGVRFRPSNFH